MAGRDPSMYGSRDRVPVLSVGSSGTSRERSLSQDRLASASHDRDCDTPARAHLSSPSGISSVFEHGHSAWDRHACKFVDAEDGSNRGTKRSVRRQVRRRQVFQVSCGATGDALQKLVALQKDRAARRSRKDNSRKTVASSRTGRAPAVAG